MCEISVIIPVYNKSRYLRDTVRCVLDQTCRDYELLLIDDGSSDGSEKLCDELALSDERIKVCHTQNRGVSAARNLGIRMASGRYIGFIDADDRMDVTFLEKLHTAISEGDADMSVCGYYEMKYGVRTDRDLGQSDTGIELYDVLRYNVLCVLWNKLFVKEKIRHLFDERLSTAEDSIFCVQYYLDNRPKIAYVYENLYEYVRHGDGLTGALQERALYGIRRLYQLNRRLVAQIPDRQVRALAVHHIYKVYFYGVYTFIFENVCEGPMTKETLRIIGDRIADDRYRKRIKYILRYPYHDRRAEYTTKKEALYILFSLTGMKRAIYALAKVKKCLDPYKNRW